MPENIDITVDLTVFEPVSAIDTCSIWNLHSSPRLLMAALEQKRWFVVAGYVRYEALEKPRKRPTMTELRMQAKFREHLAAKRGFSEAPVTVEDLEYVAASQDARRLGHGEIAALALARHLRCALLTDDQGARKVAPRVGVAPAQTTPQLFGWLVYERSLTDGDAQTVISQHEAEIEANRGRLTAYLRAMYEEACRRRLLRDWHGSEQSQTG
jgi:predicted nucleic acid-binding protein